MTEKVIKINSFIFSIMKTAYVTSTLLGILVALIISITAVTSHAKDMNITVFDASAGMESGGGAVWKLILDYVAEKENWSINYLNGTLSEGLEHLIDEKIDLLTAVPYRHAGKHPEIITQEAVICTWAQIYTHAGVSLQSLPELHGKAVGLVQGDFNNSDSRNVLTGLGIDLMPIEFKSGEDMLKALENKWIDAAVVDRFFGAAKSHQYNVVKTSIIFSPMDYRFAVPPASMRNILNVVDYHLRAMKKDPGSIYNRHLESLFGKNTDLRLLKYLKYGLSIVIICLLAVTVHAFVLQYRVNVRTLELTKKNRDLNDALAKRQKAEHAQRASENRFYSLFHASPEGIVIHDIVCDQSKTAIDYVITDTNPAFTKHTGMDREQVLGKRAGQVYGFDAPPHLAIYADTALNGTPHQFETFFEPLDKYFSVTVYSPDHGQFVTVFEDSTARKRAEESIKASEEKYRLLVDNAHDLIVVAQDGVVKFANPSARNVFGYENDNLDNLSLSRMIHPEDRGAVLKNFDFIKNNGTSQLRYPSFRALTKAGKVRWLQMNTVQIDWNKKPAALCIMRDITEAKQMESKLAQAQKMQAIGTLAGGIAHDFNNILSAIFGYTELCKIKAAKGDDLNGHLDQIFKAGQRAKDLVNQILTFSHQKEKNEKPIEIKYCIKETLNLLQATMPSNIEIKHDIQKESGIVMADQTQIHQIIMNLCTNAAHAMQEDGGVLEISLRNIDFDQTTAAIHQRLESGPYVDLTVSDTGHGMNQETLQRIFDPYFTTKRKGEGTGLGLSVVHGIVKNLNGVIKVYSEPGSGTTFNIYLPRVNTPLEPTISPAADLPGGSETILLVDDEPMVLDMTAEMLEGLGYDVVSRTNSVEALQVFKMNPDRLDLVITDQTMPNMTGKKLAQQIMNVRPDLPIILCTGFSVGINEKKALSMGICAFIKKPILRKELAAVVRSTLDKP